MVPKRKQTKNGMSSVYEAKDCLCRRHINGNRRSIVVKKHTGRNRNIGRCVGLQSRGWGRRVAASLAIGVSLLLAGSALAAEPVGPGLSGKLRGLLVEEMTQIEAAMQAAYSAIVQGNHGAVAQKGQAIHDSFILEQSLTEQDRRDLKAAVPQKFLQIDQRFHRLAAALAQAGRQKNTREQVDVFNRMTESCVACHSRYVTDRFEGLQEQLLPQGWGHDADSEDRGLTHD